MDKDKGDYEPIEKDISYSYKVPAVPAIVAFLYAKCFYVFGPYWVILLFFYLVKDRLLFRGVSILDWVFFAIWVPITIISVYFARKMFRSMEILHFILWIITSIITVVLEIYFVALASTVLYLEYVITILILICHILLIIGGILGAYFQSKPRRIQPELE